MRWRIFVIDENIGQQWIRKLNVTIHDMRQVAKLQPKQEEESLVNSLIQGIYCKNLTIFKGKVGIVPGCESEFNS